MTAQTISTAAKLSAFSTEATTTTRNSRVWAGRVLTGVAALFFLMDGGMKLFKPPVVVETTLQLGYPESTIVGIGIVLLACTLLYLIPRTAVLGAILLTGYLGGAVATHVRVSAPSFNILFPVLFGAFVWGGLTLRKANVRSLLPLMRYAATGGSSPRTVWAGRILSALPVLFFLINGITTLFKPQYVVEGTLQMGYPESSIVGMGIVLVACTILYVLPQTVVLGAVLLTGYLGGAVATHVRLGDPWSNILFPVVFGVVVWSGLWLRNEGVRQMLGGSERSGR
jgi:hypothetical protein